MGREWATIAGMTSQRYIALLRGINVGRAKRIAMADLRRLVAQLGFQDVRTLLNSGNVVFSADASSAVSAARRIAEGIVLKLGVAARVTVLSCDELDAIIADCSLVPIAPDGARLLAFVPADPSSLRPLQPLLAEDWAPGAVAVGSRAAYVWCPEGVLESKAAMALGRLLGDEVTARNWNTLLKLQKLCAEPALGLPEKNLKHA
jgi:uncharacterized protein (DUF1697 family)